MIWWIIHCSLYLQYYIHIKLYYNILHYSLLIILIILYPYTILQYITLFSFGATLALHLPYCIRSRKNFMLG